VGPGAVKSANEELLDRIVRHQIHIERMKAGEVAALITALNELDGELMALLASEEPASLGARALEAHIRAVQEVSEAATRKYAELLTVTLETFALYESGWIAAQMSDVVGPRVIAALGRPKDGFAPVPENLMRAAVHKRPLQGRLLKEWVADLDAGRKRRLAASIRTAAIEQKTIPELVREIRGTRANAYKDGVLEISRRGAETLARTSLQHISVAARETTFQQNSDVVKGVKWISVLDMRTTPQCRTLDGTVFPLGKGPRPPIHPGCRSSITPALVSLSELFGKDIPDSIDDRTRASMNGQVPADLTYGEWLRQQSASVQDEVLGPTRGKLFRQGGLTIDRFTDSKSLRSLTLKELQKREPAAWAKAFAD
jgi:SPP1 gp7 family putative phage head morphogenesis protein